MKRNLLLLAVMIVAMLSASHSWAQCPQDPIDLGICDTLYVETFDCDHTYQGTGGYDSVRLAIYVTHDSNTFWWDGGQRFVQDSISGFVIPLLWSKSGCADSVVFPTYLNWNNKQTNPAIHQFKRSIFRNITDTHTGDSVINAYASMMNDLFWDPWTVSISFTGNNAFLAMIAPGFGKWWEGSRRLLATFTFLIYGLGPDPDCDSADICVDSTFWPPASNLAFTRYDAVNYVPRHFLPVCDTIYVVPCLPPQITCPANESKPCNGTYTTTTTFTATSGGSPGINVTAVNATAPVGVGIAAASVVYLPGDTPPPAAVVIGHVQYTVDDHSLPGGLITVTATNNCAPPLSAQCTFNVTLTNIKPTITCPPNVSGPYHIMLVSGTYTDFDECVPPTVTMRYEGFATNPPQLNLVDKKVEWQAYCTEIITVWLIVTDDDHATDSCSFTMTGTNQAPSCDVDLPPAASATFDVPGTFSYSDPNGVGTVNTVTAGDFTTTCGTVKDVVDNENGTGTFTYTAPDEAGTCIVCVTVTDENGILTSQCCDTINITTEPFNQVKIPNTVYERFHFGHWDYFPWQDPPAEDNYIILDDACPPYNGINPGDFFEIPIILRNFDPGLSIGGFELEVDFDYIDLTFYGAMRGALLEKRLTAPNPIPWQDDIFWSWEYFTYRVLPCVTCACCKYKIELYGQAELPDGPFRRGYSLNSSYAGEDSLWWYVDSTAGNEIGATVAWLKFQVANNELLRDLKLPIVFEWEHKLGWSELLQKWVIIQDWDCAENTMSDRTGYILYVSNDQMQYSTSVCPFDTSQIKNILMFLDGGVHICSPCTAFTCVRGDINLNDIAHEVADAVLFARYFVYGINVFGIDRDKQVCASDVNADGRTLMLADLIYLIRVIQHDAVPFPKLGPSSDVANLIVSDGRITVECASQIGGLLFEFDGSVNATLLNTNMEILSSEGKVLVWSSAGNSINAGASQILSASGANLASVIAVDRDGRELATTITTKLAPSTFALHSAYPNPFNPATNLSFTLPTATPYSLNIYNVAGQLVRTYEGMGNVGLNVITWNGKDNAGSEVSSGVYFYKLIAGSFTATNKMVMMK